MWSLSAWRRRRLLARHPIADDLWQLIRAALALAVVSWLGGLAMIWYPLKAWLGTLDRIHHVLD